jgi:hypothetical protein
MIWSPEWYLVRNTDHKALCYVVFSIPLLSRPSYAKYPPQHPILQNPQPTFLPQCKRPSFTPIQNNQQDYSSVYLNLYTFWYKTGRQKILHRMITSIPWFQSALHFFMNRILIRWNSVQMFKLLKSFKRFITYLDVLRKRVIPKCMSPSTRLHGVVTFFMVFCHCGSTKPGLGVGRHYSLTARTKWTFGRRGHAVPFYVQPLKLAAKHSEYCSSY